MNEESSSFPVFCMVTVFPELADVVAIPIIVASGSVEFGCPAVTLLALNDLTAFSALMFPVAVLSSVLDADPVEGLDVPWSFSIILDCIGFEDPLVCLLLSAKSFPL